MLQLLFTTICCSIAVGYEPAKEWIRENYWLHYVALFGGIVCMCSLVCCLKNARKTPRNYILLSIFTVFWSYMVAGFTQWFEPSDVITAAAITTGMVLGLTLFACCCKMRLTWLWGIGAALSCAIWPLIIFMIFIPSKMLYNLICFLVVILTSIYIVWDTKMIMTRLSLDEYVIGALMLYTDII